MTPGLLTLAEVLEATGGTLAHNAPESAAGLALTSVSIDTRTLEKGALFVAIRGPRFDGHAFVAAAAERGAKAVVMERGADSAGLPMVIVQDTTRALGELARFVRRRAALPLVAITGSVGKTTTKEMTAQLLATRGPVLRTEGNLNNQYGLPLTLLRLQPQHTAAVVELGMSAPGEIRALSRLATPDVAVITRVAPVHLEFFASVDEIAAAKAEILEGLGPRGTAVLNADDPRVRRIGERHTGHVVWFGSGATSDVRTGAWRAGASGMRFELRLGSETVEVQLPLLGSHAVSNFAAAAAAAHVLGIPAGAIAAAAGSLRPARHRGELRRLGQEVVLLDDCYNSSPLALEAAVEALALVPGRRHVAILGDMLELGPAGPQLHRERGRALAGRVDVVAGVGPLAKEILAGAVEGGLGTTSLFAFDDATTAAAALPDLVQPQDAVLVKASRGVHLETVVEALVARFGEGVA